MDQQQNGLSICDETQLDIYIAIRIDFKVML